MTTPAVTVSMSQVAAELGQPNAGINMDRSDVRALGQVSATPGSAFSMSSLRSRTCETKTLNVGTEGAGAYGYQSNLLGGPYGALSPSTMRGVEVYNASYLPAGSGAFNLALQSGVAANYLYALLIRNANVAVSGTLPFMVLLMSDATFTTVTGIGRLWQWTNKPGVDWASHLGQNCSIQVLY